MFYLDFLVSLGPILLEKTIFGYSKAVKAVEGPSMGKFQTYSFWKGILFFQASNINNDLQNYLSYDFEERQKGAWGTQK